MSKGWVTLKEWQTAIEIQLNQPNQSISGLVDVSSPDWSLRLYFSTVANQVRLNGCPLHTVKPDILRVKAMIAECRKCWWEVLMRSADEKCWWEVLMRSADEKWCNTMELQVILASWDVIEVLQFVAAAQEMLLTRLKMSFLGCCAGVWAAPPPGKGPLQEGTGCIEKTRTCELVCPYQYYQSHHAWTSPVLHKLEDLRWTSACEWREEVSQGRYTVNWTTLLSKDLWKLLLKSGIGKFALTERLIEYQSYNLTLS